MRNETYDAPQNEEDLSKYIYQVIYECEEYSSNQRDDRDTALEYYDGIMDDVPTKKGRSSVVSGEIRKTIKRIMPSVMRTIWGKEDVIEYIPSTPEGAQMAAQASAYVNHVIAPKNKVTNALYDAIFDAMVLKTGILHWSADQNQSVKYYSYSEQPAEVMEAISQMPGVEVLDVQPDEDGPEPVFSFRTRVTETKKEVCLQAIPRGAFLISPDAHSIEDAAACGHTKHLTRSELVSMGFDRAEVNALMADENTDDGTFESEGNEDAYRGDDNHYEYGDARTKATEIILTYFMYVNIDMDDDGIAEIFKVICAKSGDDEMGGGKSGSFKILEAEPVAEKPYAAVTVERTAHQFEGHSLAEDVRHFQRVKTALLRGTLDNLYWQNYMQIYVQQDALVNPEEVMNPEFGRPVFLKQGADARQAIQFNPVPFIGDRSFQMQEYLDQEVQQLTGLNDRSTGLDPESLQNVTATAATVMNESGLAQSQMMIKQLCKGISVAFTGILGLIVAHAEKEEVVMVNGNWVPLDPRVWDSDLRCSVNIGLGTGSRDSDIAILQVILNMQKEIIEMMGPENPIVKTSQVYNTIQRIVETSGLPSVAPYFTEPDPQEMQQFIEGQEKEKSRENEDKMKLEQMKAQMKAQMDIQLKQQEAQTAMAMEQQKQEVQQRIEIIKTEAKQEAEAQKFSMQERMEVLKTEAQREVERAQMEADITVKRDEFMSKLALEERKLELEAEKIAIERERLMLDRMKHEDDVALKQQEINQNDEENDDDDDE